MHNMDGAGDDDASGLDDLFMRQGPQINEKTADNMSLASRVHDKPTVLRPTVMTNKAPHYSSSVPSR